MLYLWLTWLLAPLLRHWAGPAIVPPRRILVIQLAKIGDLICSTPVFREIKRRHPGASLHVMATAQNIPLLEANPHVDAVITASSREFRGLKGKWHLRHLLRQGRYDTVVCLNAGAAYAVATLWAGIPLRLAVQSNFAGASHRLAARLWSAIEPHSGKRLIQETYLALLAHLDVSGGTVDREVFVSPGAEERVHKVFAGMHKPLIGIGVSSANQLKSLGSETIIAVARELLRTIPHTRLVLIGGPEDKAQATAIRSALPEDTVLDACGSLSLAELPVLLRELEMFIGVDSGITHMADAVGIPLLSVAGPCNMRETRPLGKNAVILQRNDLPCLPCSHAFRTPYTCHVGTRACVTGISASEIAAATLALWRNNQKEIMP